MKTKIILDNKEGLTLLAEFNYFIPLHANDFICTIICGGQEYEVERNVFDCDTETLEYYVTHEVEKH